MDRHGAGLRAGHSEIRRPRRSGDRRASAGVISPSAAGLGRRAGVNHSLRRLDPRRGRGQPAPHRRRGHRPHRFNAAGHTVRRGPSGTTRRLAQPTPFRRRQGRHSASRTSRGTGGDPRLAPVTSVSAYSPSDATRSESAAVPGTVSASSTRRCVGLLSGPMTFARRRLAPRMGRKTRTIRALLPGTCDRGRLREAPTGTAGRRKAAIAGPPQPRRHRGHVGRACEQVDGSSAPALPPDGPKGQNRGQGRPPRRRRAGMTRPGPGRRIAAPAPLPGRGNVIKSRVAAVAPAAPPPACPRSFHSRHRRVPSRLAQASW